MEAGVSICAHDDEVSVQMRGSRQKEIANIDVSLHEGPSVRTGAMTHQVETERHEVAHMFCFLIRICWTCWMTSNVMVKAVSTADVAYKLVGFTTWIWAR